MAMVKDDPKQRVEEVYELDQVASLSSVFGDNDFRRQRRRPGAAAGRARVRAATRELCNACCVLLERRGVGDVVLISPPFAQTMNERMLCLCCGVRVDSDACVGMAV